ncbi:MAG: hypothetical protein COY42_27655 [Armatimonadetes bacterium CG_4_10_14_0_8_um_filter_66_14]|nr:MAG: hypothetical protein COY42_27655 [Armatimonadetes bacterium CG_4_10_14_0_8_um_filter_66_14]
MVNGGKAVTQLFKTGDAVAFELRTQADNDAPDVLEGDLRLLLSVTVRATIPLAELGFTPEPGKTYRGDFGIIHSDALGKTNELRMHWANQATGIVSDRALEAQIDPRQWGVFEVKAQ